MNSNKEKLIYIDHSFHKKTKSNLFLVDILRKRYDVDYIYYDPEKEEYDLNGIVQGDPYDVLLLFQVIVDIKDLKERFKAKKYVYVPMYDGTGEMPDSFWINYKDFNIINFSSTLHNRLINKGLSSHYIQYFPEPKEFVQGESRVLYFWQRKEELDWSKTKEITRNLAVEKVVFHDSADPGQKLNIPSHEDIEKYKMDISSWYADKNEMYEEIKKCQMYFSPRLYEGIGMSFLEAMAMGKLVIAANNPTMNEYIENGKTGLLFNGTKPVVSLDDEKIRVIQKNTYDYMCNGYRDWINNRDIICDWVIEDVKVCDRKIKRLEKTAKLEYVRYAKIGIILLTFDGKTWKLLNVLPCNRRIIEVMVKIIKKIRQI